MGEWKAVALIATLAAGFSAQALTKYSEHIDKLQNTFGEASSLHKIVYMDRDRLRRRLAVKDATGDEKVRNQVMMGFVKDRIGVEVDEVTADHIGDFFETDSNLAIPFTVQDSGEKICVIFPSEPNLNSTQEVHRLLYWEALENTEEYQHKTIKKIMEKEQLTLLADIHETFHCLDPYYAVLREINQYENDKTIHKAESFAEVGALLYLAGQGHTNLVETRVLYRLIGSFMVGRHQDKLGISLDDINWGVVYSFYPAMFAAQESIDQGFQKSSVEEIISVAHQIVEENSFDEFASHAVRQYQKDPESLYRLIEDFKTDDNPNLVERFAKIEVALGEYLPVLETSFDQLLAKKTEIIEYSRDAVHFDSQKDCPRFSPEDEDSYYAEIDRLRGVHYQSSRPKSSREYQALVKMPECLAAAIQ